MNEQTRAYVYRIALALLGLAVVYGFVTDAAVAPWAALIAALFPVGLAAKNTSTKP